MPSPDAQIAVVFACKRLEAAHAALIRQPNSATDTKINGAVAAALAAALAALAGARPPVVDARAAADALHQLGTPATVRIGSALGDLPSDLPRTLAVQLACTLASPAEAVAGSLANLLRAQHTRAAGRRAAAAGNGTSAQINDSTAAGPPELKSLILQENAAIEALADIAASLVSAAACAIPHNFPMARLPPPLTTLLLIQLPHLVSSHIRLGGNRVNDVDPADKFNINSNDGTGPKNASPISKPSESLQLAVVRLLYAMLSAEEAVLHLIGDKPVPRNFILDLTAPIVQPTLAHLITILIDLAASKTSLSLRIMALDTVTSLLKLMADPDRVAQMLPGIVSAIMRIALANNHVPHRLLVVCLNLVCEAIVSATADAHCSGFLPTTSPSTIDLITRLRLPTAVTDPTQSRETQLSAAMGAQPSSISNSQPGTGEFHRSAEWLAKTASRIAVIVDRLCMLRRHDHPSVREAVVEFAARIASKCPRTLSGCLSTFIDTIVLVKIDDVSTRLGASDLEDRPADLSDIQNHIRTCLGDNDDAWPTVVDQIQDRLGELLDSFPRTVRAIDESVILETLRLITGYIGIFGSRAETKLKRHAKPLIQGLLHLINFDLGGVHVVGERHAVSGAALVQMEPAESLDAISRHYTVVSAPRRRLASISNTKILDHVRLLCRLAATHAHGDFFTDEFVTLLADRKTQAQAVFVLGELCLGASSVGKPGNAGISCAGSDTTLMLQSVAAELLALPALSLPTNVIDGRLFGNQQPQIDSPDLAGRSFGSTLTVSEMSNRILTTSLVLESLGKIAFVLPSHQATLVLMDGLYVILEKLGDRNHTVSDTAAWTLKQFANMCGVSNGKSFPQQSHALAPGSASLFGASIPATPAGNPSSIASLVLEHVDYLIDSVSRRLRHIRHNPLAPKVLTAAIRVAGQAIVGPLTSDCIELLLDVLEDIGTTGSGMQLDSNEISESFSAKLMMAKPASTSAVAKSLRPTDPDDPGLAGELMSVLYALIEVISQNYGAAHPRKPRTMVLPNPTATKNGLAENLDAHMNSVVGAPDCSPEMRVYLLERQREPNHDDDDVKGLSSEEYFKQRIRDADMAKKTVDAGDSVEPATGEKQEPDGDDNGMSSNTQETELPPATPSETVTLQILSKAIHFLSSDVPIMRARVLRMFQMGIPVLVSRSTDLNPLVHHLWPRLMMRCQDMHHYVALEAVKTVAVVADTTPDFVRKRISEDVIPRVTRVLKSLQNEVIDATSASQHTQFPSNHKASNYNKRNVVRPLNLVNATNNDTVAHMHFLSDTISTDATRNRLFIACIDMLSSIISNVQLHRRDQDQLANVVFGLLNTRLFSPTVQSKAVALLSDLAVRTGGDWIWALAWITVGADQLYADVNGADHDDSNTNSNQKSTKSHRLCTMYVTDAVRKAYAPTFGTPDHYAANLSQVLCACKSPFVSSIPAIPSSWITLNEGVGQWKSKLPHDNGNSYE